MYTIYMVVSTFLFQVFTCFLCTFIYVQFGRGYGYLINTIFIYICILLVFTPFVYIEFQMGQTLLAASLLLLLYYIYIYNKCFLCLLFL